MMVLRRVPTTWILGFSIALLASCLATLCRPQLKGSSYDIRELLFPSHYSDFSKHSIFDYSNYEGHILGIDLGREYSRVAIFRNHTFEVIPDKEGRTAIPNHVAFPSDGPPLIGFKAIEQASKSPAGTFREFRALIGRSYDDPELQAAIQALPYEVLNADGNPSILMTTNGDSTFYTPENISTIILNGLKVMAENHVNATISHAIISIPSYFSNDQKKATKEAAEAAGLTVVRLIPESTAIAVAYFLDVRTCDEVTHRENCTYLLYDHKENEDNIALISMDRGVYVTLATASKDLGTESFELESSLLQSKTSNGHEYEQVLNSVQKLLEKIEFEKKDVDGIVVTGDSPKLSKIQEILEDYFPGKKEIDSEYFPRKEAIVYGLAVLGEIVRGWDRPDYYGYEPYPDSTYLSIGIETSTGEFMKLIRGNTIIPTRKSLIVTTSADNQEKVVVSIFEGEREIASKNKLIGTLDLAISPKTQKEQVEIEVAFEVDPNTVLKAIVKMKAGPETTFVIPLRYSAGPGGEIDRIVEEGRLFHDEDLKLLKETPMEVLNGIKLLEPEFIRKETLARPISRLWQWLFG